MKLDEELIKKFMGRLAVSATHNINIMNEKGIIIASSKFPTRVGTFHEMAFNMLTKNIPEASVDIQTAYAGTMIGVNLLVRSDGENIGVCGVTGKPEEVYDIAVLVKMALENMLEYESQYVHIQERKNLKLRFRNTLLYAENDELVKQLPEMAGELGYDAFMLRIPLLIHFEVKTGVDIEALHTKLKASSLCGKQDIVLITRNNCIMFFKAFNSTDMEQVMGEYRSEIDNLVANIQDKVLEHKCQVSFYVGCFQNQLLNYAYEFKHLKWIRGHYHGDGNQAIYFYDHVGEYMTYTIPVAEIHKIFHVFAGYMPQELCENLTETISSLEINNYNMNTTSQQLFIHKNTLIFRFNKIKKFFNINPVQFPEDRYFASYMAFYLKNLAQEKQQSSGNE